MTMKVQVWDGPKEPENVLRLRLVPSGDNAVELQAVDANGVRLSGGSILTIYKNGVMLHGSLHSDIPVEKDDRRAIKVIGR